MHLLIPILLPFPGLCQDQVFESIQLDSLIFETINEYRASKGEKHFKAFEDSLMRDFSYNLTRSNSAKDQIQHSDGEFTVYNAECIFSHEKFGSQSATTWFTDQIESGNYTPMAQMVVEGWVESPSHERAISHESYTIATVTSRISLDHKNKKARLVVSYHALSTLFGTTDKYVYPLD